jgi:hypothetical protein
MFEELRPLGHDRLLDLMADIEMLALGVLGYVLVLAVPISSPLLSGSIAALSTVFLGFAAWSFSRRLRSRRVEKS